MADENSNKHNLLFFESNTMLGLYEAMDQWQCANEKRFLSTNIQRDKGKFCCIALTNPTEVVILAKDAGTASYKEVSCHVRGPVVSLWTWEQ
jgi:hypothetical protein